MEIKQYIRPLLKWWWLILGSTLVAAASSVYAVQQQPNIYQARSAIMLGQVMNNPNPTGQEFGLAQQLGQTYVNIAQRSPVADATKAALGMEWLPQYTVSMVPNTQLIQILVSDTSPERAMVVANELARQIVQSSPTSAQEQEEQERQAFVKEQLDELQTRIEETRREITTKEAELGQLISARQIADTQTQIAGLENKLRTLQSNYGDLFRTTQQGAINSLSLFEEASLPTGKIGPNRLSTVLTAAAIGFVLGVAAAYLLEYLDDTVKTREDVERLTGLPTLTGIARMKMKGTDDYPLITREKPQSPVSEAYRGLRTALMFTQLDKQTDMILITSPGAQEGKSLTTANLGVVLAQAGRRVLIVDADLRRPTQHVIFGLREDQRGLTDVLLTLMMEQQGEAEGATPEVVFSLLEGMVHETEQSGLYLLTSGTLPPNPAELAASVKMGELLENLSAYFDVVLIDSPPVLAATDAVVLSTRADGVLLVASYGRTRRSQLEQAAERLRDVRATVYGVIMNRLSGKADGYYSFYSYSDPLRQGSPDSGKGETNGRRGLFGRKGQAERPRLPNFTARTKP